MNATVAIFSNIGTIPQVDYMAFVIENDISDTWYEIAKMSIDHLGFEERKRKAAMLKREIELAIK